MAGIFMQVSRKTVWLLARVWCKHSASYQALTTNNSLNGLALSFKDVGWSGWAANELLFSGSIQLSICTWMWKPYAGWCLSPSRTQQTQECQDERQSFQSILFYPDTVSLKPRQQLCRLGSVAVSFTEKDDVLPLSLIWDLVLVRPHLWKNTCTNSSLHTYLVRTSHKLQDAKEAKTGEHRLNSSRLKIDVCEL